MKPHFHSIVASFALSFGMLSTSHLSAYDVPNFDREVFHPDGIFLEESERQSLLEALAAVASNFPESNRIDSDLKEKALATALRINPLHRNCRSAHELLTVGRLPSRTQYFDSVSGASEALWSTGLRLLEEPIDPEEKKLASILMELSLLMHPEPPMERMKRFALVLDEKVNDWEKIITVQRNDNPSSVRSANLIRETQDILEKMKLAPIPVMPKGGSSRATPGEGKSAKVEPKKDRPPRPDSPRVFQVQSRALPVVRNVTAVDSVIAAGIFRLELRKISGDIEKEIFSFASRPQVSEYPRIPVLPAPRGIPISEVTLPMSVAAGRGWNWSPGRIAEISFEPEERVTLPGPPRLSHTRAVLPTMILLESILADKNLNPEFAVAGELDEVTMLPKMSGSILETIEEAKSLEKPYLLLPDSVVPDFVSELQQSGDLAILFSMELISFATIDDAIAHCTGGVAPGLEEAISAFAEVKAKSDSMPLMQFAKNPNVQQRLQAIVDAYPNHLSSKAMLAFGKTPISPEIMIRQSVSSIDLWIKPYLSIGDSTDLNELKNRFEDDELGLSRLRNEVHPDARDYFDKAEDLLEAAELYINLSNLGSSIGQQRLREVEELIDEVKDQKAILFGGASE